MSKYTRFKKDVYLNTTSVIHLNKPSQHLQTNIVYYINLYYFSVDDYIRELGFDFQKPSGWVSV